MTMVCICARSPAEELFANYLQWSVRRAEPRSKNGHVLLTIHVLCWDAETANVRDANIYPRIIRSTRAADIILSILITASGILSRPTTLFRYGKCNKSYRDVRWCRRTSFSTRTSSVTKILWTDTVTAMCTALADEKYLWIFKKKLSENTAFFLGSWRTAGGRGRSNEDITL